MTMASVKRNALMAIPGIAIWLTVVLVGHDQGWIGDLPLFAVIGANVLGFISCILFILGVFLPLGVSLFTENLAPHVLAQPSYSGVRYLAFIFGISDWEENR